MYRAFRDLGKFTSRKCLQIYEELLIFTVIPLKKARRLNLFPIDSLSLRSQLAI